jgi:hypothetical protein
VGAFVLERDQAFRESLVFQKTEMAFGETDREKRQAFADQCGDDAQVEFIDQVVLEERAGELASTHVPDFFSPALAQLGDERLRIFIDEGDAVAFAGWKRPREDVFVQAVVGEGAAAQAQADLVGLAAHESGVDGFEKGSHGVILRHEEEVDGAVEACDVAVEGDSKAEDDETHQKDCSKRQSRIGKFWRRS